MGLSNAEIAGVVVGCVVAVGLAIAIFIHFRRQLLTRIRYEQYLKEQRQAELVASLEFDTVSQEETAQVAPKMKKIQMIRHAASEKHLINHEGSFGKVKSGASEISQGGSFNNRSAMVRGNSGLEAKASRALRYSVLRGETQLLQEQVKKGTFSPNDILDVKTKGRALHLSATKGRNAVVLLLLEMNADASISDSQGKTAADLAKEKGFAQLSELIASHARRQKSGQMIASKVQAHMQKSDKKLSRSKSVFKQISGMGFRSSMKSLFGNGKVPNQEERTASHDNDDGIQKKLTALDVRRAQSGPESGSIQLEGQGLNSSSPGPQLPAPLAFMIPEIAPALKKQSSKSRRLSLPTIRDGDSLNPLAPSERRRSLPDVTSSQEVAGMMSSFLVRQLEQVLIKKKYRRRSSPPPILLQPVPSDAGLIPGDEEPGASDPGGGLQGAVELEADGRRADGSGADGLGAGEPEVEGVEAPQPNVLPREVSAAKSRKLSMEGNKEFAPVYVNDSPIKSAFNFRKEDQDFPIVSPLPTSQDLLGDPRSESPRSGRSISPRARGSPQDSGDFEEGWDLDLDSVGSRGKKLRSPGALQLKPCYSGVEELVAEGKRANGSGGERLVEERCADGLRSEGLGVERQGAGVLGPEERSAEGLRAQVAGVAEDIEFVPQPPGPSAPQPLGSPAQLPGSNHITLEPPNLSPRPLPGLSADIIRGLNVLNPADSPRRPQASSQLA